MKNAQISAPTRSSTETRIQHRVSTTIVLGAALLAATGTSVMAQPVQTASATAAVTTGKRSAVETRTQGSPAQGDNKPVIDRNAPAARPAHNPAPAASSQATSDDAAYLDLVKSSFGWIDLPSDMVGPKDDAAFLALVQPSFGWIDLPSDAGVKSDQEFADSIQSAFTN